jgi:acyl-CoA thioester hydrolase
MQVRVRYAETDAMGYVYYGQYATYFEVARTEAVRALGLPYTELEAAGVMLPVREMQVRFHRPARYDDLLTLTTELRELPSVRIKFWHRITNEAQALLTEGWVELVFVDANTRRPRPAPEQLIRLLASPPQQ